MPDLRVARLILYVRDVSLLKAFYQTHFGLRLTEEVENEWAVLDGGGVDVALHLAGKPYRSGAATPGANSNAKLVFSLPSGLVEFRERLIDAGVRMRGIKRYDGFPLLLCDGEDPEGNVFQIAQPV